MFTQKLFSQISSASVNIDSVSNHLITANIVTQPNWGKFWLTTSPFYGKKKLLFQNGSTAIDDQLQIWSNVIFKTEVGGQIKYFCNVPINSTYQLRPLINHSNVTVDYKPFDRVIIRKDKLEVVWDNLEGFTITMRFYPEQTISQESNGGDMIMEFDYKTTYPSAKLGVFLMLDSYNEEAGGLTGDNSLMSVLTNNLYFPTGKIGRLFTSDSIPEFYQVGNFKYEFLPNIVPKQLNNTYSIHKLTGKSFGGLALSKPDTFAIGDWDNFTRLSWEMTYFDVNYTNLSDVTTISKWGNLTGNGIIRTAFSASIKEVNNFFVCRDEATKLFSDIRCVKNIVQSSLNGPYSTSSSIIEMYLGNISTTDSVKKGKVRIVNPFTSYPANDGRLVLDALFSTQVQTFDLAPMEVKKFVWKIDLNNSSSDTLVNLFFRFDVGKGEFSFKDDCTPSINIKPFKLIKIDTIPPIIKLVTNGISPNYYWDYDIFDKHVGYFDDSGVRSVQVAPNDNFIVTPANIVGAPAPYKLCDTSITLKVRAQVADSNKPANMVLCVTDCNGNKICDTISYAPKLDSFPPECVRIDSLGSADLIKFPSNSHEYRVQLIDSSHKGVNGSDYGFGSIVNIGSQNYDPIEINYDKGGAPILNFDKAASFSVKVTDTTKLARISIKVTDFVGNSKLISLEFSPLPDIYPPLSDTVLNANNTSWTVNINDKRSFDRGLKNVVQLYNLNFNFNQPLIPAGSKDFSFQVSVNDQNKFGELILEVQDMYYDIKARGHADTIHFYFGGRGDTRKPIIQYKNIPNSNPGLVQVEYQVDILDIHIDNNVLYPFDRGLKIVEALPAPSTTPNFRLTSPIILKQGDKSLSFKIGVIDTLANSTTDSICIRAVDLADNEEISCYVFSLKPDLNSPVLDAEITNDFLSLKVNASDSRIYDRGLGEVLIENPVNLKISELPADIEGFASSKFQISILNPKKNVSGVLVLRDRIGKQDLSPSTQNIHTVKIPFALPAYNIYINTPQVVEGGSDFEVPITCYDDFTISNETKSIDFNLKVIGTQVILKGSSNLLANVSATSLNKDSISIRIIATKGTKFRKGDIFGKLTFSADAIVDVETTKFLVVPNSNKVNGGIGSEITIQKLNDTSISRLKLPAPLLTVYFDSLMYVNGTCQRVLQASPKGNILKTTTEILTIIPNPVTRNNNKIELHVRNLNQNSFAEFIDIYGNVLQEVSIDSEVKKGNQISKGLLTVPNQLPEGAYYLHIKGTNAISKIIIQR